MRIWTRAWNYGLTGHSSISGRIITVSIPYLAAPTPLIGTDTIQRSIAVDPDAVRSSTNADDGETAAIIMQLRQKLKAQTDEVTALQSKLGSVHAEYQKEVS
jgi:hypothetical protein